MLYSLFTFLIIAAVLAGMAALASAARMLREVTASGGAFHRSLKQRKNKRRMPDAFG